MKLRFPPAQDHTWDRIFKEQGRFYREPIARLREVAKAFHEAGCQRVLNLGCGGGRHTIQLAWHGIWPVGMDISPRGLRLTVEWLREEGLTASLLQADFRRPLPHHYFTEKELRDCLAGYAIREISLRAEGRVRVLLAAKP